MLSVPANRTLPRRVDSLVASKGPYFVEVEEELRDIKRVNSQGQEEDLKLALSRTICRVEELMALLKEAFKTQTEMQTELTLTKSNLQLALANNEMLEDALKRDASGSARDIGWRRWSAKEQKEREAEEERRRSVDSAGSVDVAHSQKSPIPPHAHSPAIKSPLPRSASVFSPITSDSRFFKFRFGSGSATSATFPASPHINGASTSVSVSATGSPSPNVAAQTHTSHLTSASLPSLVPSYERDKEFEDLTEQLKREREARKKAAAAKDTLEAEIESLSQALFEEANKMVATERRKLAETEDELREACAEREALRSALRLVERQCGSLSADPRMSSQSAPLPRTHSRARSSSSAIAIKSLPSSEPSSPDSELTPDSAQNATSAGTVVATSYPPRPPPLNLVEPDSPLFAPPTPEVMPLTASPDALGIHQPASSLNVPHSPSVGPTRTPSPAPSLPGRFILSPGVPVDYLVTEESPWADVESKSPQPAS
ncbi:hypothetical protein BKA93DRAFT_572604 [Sparassis latifolia]|uniref:GDP/GTP exchange factor Sec2 N-terminal domain-containing protein n=1 Tax=Sparassis crispa TaxID=139825 RepID=A0A401GDS7_9APHY|nr:predicted protein [Sparassis crispa]GBE80291.1 predicted protein [Sparassis crispa]